MNRTAASVLFSGMKVQMFQQSLTVCLGRASDTSAQLVLQATVLSDVYVSMVMNVLKLHVLFVFDDHSFFYFGSSAHLGVNLSSASDLKTSISHKPFQ